MSGGRRPRSASSASCATTTPARSMPARSGSIPRIGTPRSRPRATPRRLDDKRRLVSVLRDTAPPKSECVERGEEVRILLSEYRRSHSVYPETLNQLRSPIICARISRPTLLTYERTTNGYTLSFHDWLVHHAASEDQSFLAHK